MYILYVAAAVAAVGRLRAGALKEAGLVVFLIGHGYPLAIDVSMRSHADIVRDVDTWSPRRVRVGPVGRDARAHLARRPVVVGAVRAVALAVRLAEARRQAGQEALDERAVDGQRGADNGRDDFDDAEKTAGNHVPLVRSVSQMIIRYARLGHV